MFKPLLASPVEFDKLDFDNLLVSPKLDGIRCIVIGGVVRSRNLKPIPNKHIQAMFSHLEYYDGELIVGDPTSKTCYRDTASGVMSVAGTPHVTFYVFDHIEEPDADYRTRYEKLDESAFVRRVLQTPVSTLEELLCIEESYLEQGYEGVMIRKGRGPLSKYKFGRATAKSNTLLKLKRFSDAEYKIVGFQERMHNANEATTNALGHTERSSHKENKIGRGDLGALVLVTPDGQEFNCGTGFDDEDRAAIWNNRDYYLGKFAKVKSFLIGGYDVPRFPVWLGFRDQIDI